MKSFDRKREAGWKGEEGEAWRAVLQVLQALLETVPLPLAVMRGHVSCSFLH